MDRSRNVNQSTASGEYPVKYDEKSYKISDVSFASRYLSICIGSLEVTMIRYLHYTV